MNKHVYIKAIHFERNTKTGEMEVLVESNHGDFVLYGDVLDMGVVFRIYDYIHGKATDVITRYIADQVQQELEKTPLDRAREALEDLE